MSDVPCNGCVACCVNDAIMLHPDEGDDLSTFKHVPFRNPITGEDGYMVAKKPMSTDCYYLGSNGCKIHGRAPLICREFDCGKMFEAASDPKSKWSVALRLGLVTPEVIANGRRVTIIRNSKKAGHD